MYVRKDLVSKHPRKFTQRNMTNLAVLHERPYMKYFQMKGPFLLTYPDKKVSCQLMQVRGYFRLWD